MTELIVIKQRDSNNVQEPAHSTNAYNNHGFADEPLGSDTRFHYVSDKYEGDTQSKERDTNCYENAVMSVQSSLSAWLERNRRRVRNIFLVVLLFLYFAYFGYSLYYRFGDEGSYRLLIATVLASVLLAWTLMSRKSTLTAHWFEHVSKCFRKRKRVAWLVSLSIKLVVVAALLVYIVMDVAIDSPQNLISLAGLAAFILIFFITSTNPAKVNWNPVFWGIAIQYVFALVILRTSWGSDAFEWIGNRVTEFIENAQAGGEFVFGGLPKQKIFAFFLMPVIVFFCSIIAILYHLGVMQAIIRTIGRLLAFGLGTTPAESLNVAGNMFVSQSEALAMINPFLKDMTKSELHAALTGGFASISGSVLGAYIALGVPAKHLLTATVMSAPAALAMSKLSYPETEISKATSEDFYKIGTEKVNNLIEAAYQGATQSINLVANICINLIAFLAILKFLNNTLTWFGDRAGVDGLTFEFICSYALYPVAYLMGVDSANCRKVAELIGVKTFLNEFIAYTSLGELVNNRLKFERYTNLYNATDSWGYVNDNIFLKYWNETLERGFISKKSEAVATYALCGFSNIGAIGINMGAVLAFAPSRQTDAPKLVIRAMICGSAACFLTGAVAGLLYKEL